MGRWSTRTSRSNDSIPDASWTSTSSCLVGLLGYESEVAADDLGEHLRHQRRLSGAGHARHRRQHAQRYVDGDVVQIVAGDPAQVQPAVRGARAVIERLGAPEQVPARGRLPDPLKTGDRAAVQHASAALARTGADVDDPVRPPYDVHVVLHDEQRVARRLEAVQHVQQRFRVSRVQARGGFVEDVDDAEQPRAQLGGDPQALRLAGRQGRRAAPEAEVSEAQVEQYVDPRDQIAADPDRDLGRLPGSCGRRGGVGLGPPRDGPQQRHDPVERHRVDLGDGTSGEGHGERLGSQSAAATGGAGHTPDEPERPFVHLLALGVGEDVHDVLAGAPELALVAVVDAVLLRLDVHGGLLVRVQQPVPVLLPEPAPLPVDVDPQAAHDTAQVGALPGARPGGDRPLADAQRGVRDEQVLGDVVHDSQSVALRAGAGRGVG